jgi:UDP-N-acetylglucosamine 2-epimerase
MALMDEAGRTFKGLTSVIVHTGQHYDTNMSGVFFSQLRIPKPKYNLGAGSGSHTEQTAKMMSAMERCIRKERPDMVVVYGDTNSTLAGALTAVKMAVPVAHVEAGLRSFNRAMPEEINRVITDRISDILFCPTDTAVMNLRREGITKGVFRVNDIMIDMLSRHAAIAHKRSRILASLGLERGCYYLATVHRAANTDDPRNLRNILKALGRLDKPVVFPVHPRTKRAMSALRIKPGKNIMMIDPVPYVDMIALEMNATAVLTDSGGVQKEAHYFKVPCITLRDETEWVETVRSGWNILTGTDPAKIRKAARNFASRNIKRRALTSGGGQAARRMLAISIERIKERR